MRRTKWSLLALAALLVLAVVVGISEEVNWHGLRQSLETMDRAPLLALVAILPIFGFSVVLVYLVVGAVFGSWTGLAVIAGVTAVHLLGSHWIARSFLRAPLQRFLRRRKYRLPELPEGEEWSVVLMTALMPGLPYFVRNYLLALSGIPLRRYFWICWSVFVLRSALVIFLGDFSDDISGRRLLILGAVLAVKLAVCGYLVHRLRARHKAASGSSSRVGSATPLFVR